RRGDLQGDRAAGQHGAAASARAAARGSHRGQRRGATDPERAGGHRVAAEGGRRGDRVPVELIHADAFDPQLGLISHGLVDHVVADPAYGRKVHTRHRTTRKGAGGVRAEQDLGFEALTPDVRRRAAEAFAAVVRRWVVVFSDLEGAGAWCDDLAAAGLEPVQVGLWVKTNATPQLVGDRPASPGEALVVAHAKNGRRPKA